MSGRRRRPTPAAVLPGRGVHLTDPDEDLIRAQERHIAALQDQVKVLQEGIELRERLLDQEMEGNADNLRQIESAIIPARKACEALVGDGQQAIVKLAAGDVETAAAYLHFFTDAAARLAVGLQAITTGEIPETPAQEVPLHLLDTPANRYFEYALQRAVDAAHEVAKERGAHANGRALELAAMFAEVQQEIHGPEGRGEGPH